MSDDGGSSSSEDEATRRILRDSIDDDLLTDDLYSGEKRSDQMKRANSLPTKPSLRYIIDDKGHHDHNFIKVTPEFQEFVAKNLSKHLESQIIEKKSKHKKHKVDNTDDHPMKGIYLLNGSTKLLSSVMNEPKMKRKHCVKSTSDKLILQRASETAVSADWILKKDAIQGWTKVTKGKIMKVKKNNKGSFDIVSDEV